MDWSALKALPLGLILFAFMVWRFLRRRSGHRRAIVDYPALAGQLGLRYVRPRQAAQVGQLRGELRGFQVVVDPDEQRKIIVRFRGEPGVDLRNYELPRPPSSLAFYTSHERAINGYFKTRYAEPRVAERLNAPGLAALLSPVLGRYRHEVKEFNVTRHGVTCLLDFGSPPHIPATAIVELLPVLLDLAEVIEAAESDER